MRMMRDGITRVEDVEAFLARCGYVADREITTALFLAIRLHRPLPSEYQVTIPELGVVERVQTGLPDVLARVQSA